MPPLPDDSTRAVLFRLLSKCAFSMLHLMNSAYPGTPSAAAAGPHIAMEPGNAHSGMPVRTFSPGERHGPRAVRSVIPATGGLCVLPGPA